MSRIVNWICVVTMVLSLSVIAVAQEKKDEQKKDDQKPAAAEKDKKEKKEVKDGEPLKIKLPKPAFKGTPKNAPPGSNLEPPRKGPRPDLVVPKGTKLVSAGLPVTSSDMEPIIGSLKGITDGDKEASEGSYVELGPGLQWIQIDLKHECDIQAVVIWHYHMTARIYHDVVVQVADDKDFITNVRTVFNNDHDNSSGLGLGRDLEFWDTYEGKLIDAGSVKARYVRLYSNGSSADDQNHYVEVEVFASPPK